jgi:hypothetical protein
MRGLWLRSISAAIPPVSCREWAQLILDEFSECVFAGHSLHFLGMRELLLSERSNSRPQDSR